MKAIRFHTFGDTDVLRYEDVATPEPGPGEVLVRVAGTSFNGVDANIRAGLMTDAMPLALPHTLGVDLAGTIDALGADVGGLAVGDRVVGFLPFVADGASAEHVVAPAEVLAPAPTTIALADAAALPAVGLTAWQALVEHADLQPGQRVLVNGASGAVGLYAVQLAKAVGAHVIATGSARARDRLVARGADEVVDHTTTDVVTAVTEPVDLVLNLAPVTPEQLAALTAVIADGGVLVNTTVWMPAPGDEARGVRGIDLYVRSDSQQLSELVARVDRGELVVDVAERVALPDLASVHDRAAAGTLPGKVVVVPVDPRP